MREGLLSLIILFVIFNCLHAGNGEKIVIHGEYPVVKELKESGFEDKHRIPDNALIDYSKGDGYKEKAYLEALHFMDANVFGYTFLYKPGSMLMKTEEHFEVGLRGNIGSEHLILSGAGVSNNVYRVKLVFPITPSVQKWQGAFYSHTIRLTESEGTSDFYTGWEGRSDALRDALRNLVLTAARRDLSSKPLQLKGDILLKGNPEFSVGAGRHYCKISGFVNFIEIVTYD
jgi:hypothetical protein